MSEQPVPPEVLKDYRNMLRDDVSTYVNEIIFSLAHSPDQWFWKMVNDPSVLIHSSSGMELWVWRNDVRPYKPLDIELDFIKRFFLKRAYKRWRRDYGDVKLIQIQRHLCANATHSLKLNRIQGH